MEKRKIKIFSLRKLLIGLGVFVMFAAVFLAQNLINAQAHVISVSLSPNVTVSPPEIKFGNVYPEELLTSRFKVSLAQDCKDRKDDSKVTYSVVQKIKPKPGANPPPEFQGTISDYCQTATGQADQARCYLNLCPFLNKIPDSPKDTEATSTLGGSDKTDIWKVNFLVPDIFGSVGQENKGGVIAQGGDYGCDIAIVIKEDPSQKKYRISGIKFEDKDGDGKLDKNEQGLSGWTIYLDLNNNGILDPADQSTVTDKNGAYTFDNLPAGTYHVREVQKIGWIQTYPAGGKYDITFSANSQDASDKNFGNTRVRSCKISGHEFDDKNGNGKQDRGEEDLSGWTVQLDKADGSTITAKTDKNGNYTFDNLDCVKYSLKQNPQAGWRQTTKDSPDITLNPGDNSGGHDFGNKRK